MKTRWFTSVSFTFLFSAGLLLAIPVGGDPPGRDYKDPSFGDYRGVNCEELQGLDQCICNCWKTWNSKRRICKWLPIGGVACEHAAQHDYLNCVGLCAISFPHQIPELPCSVMTCAPFDGGMR